MKIWLFFYFDRAIARTANEPPGSRAVVHCSSPKSFDQQTFLSKTHQSPRGTAPRHPSPQRTAPTPSPPPASISPANSASAFPAPAPISPAPSRPSNSSSHIIYFFVQYIDIFVHLSYNIYIINRGDYYGKINNK